MTRQKTQPSTKKPAAKKSPAKKTTAKAQPATISRRKAAASKDISPLRFFTISIGIFVMSVSVVVVMALLTSDYIMGKGAEARTARINDVYASLELDDSYALSEKNVFGDKRVYSWDAGRSESSSVTYLRGDTVNNTVADIDARIKAAGFSFIDEPYPGNKEVQYHYKSAAGEYLRLTVSSKPYLDAYQSALIMDKNNLTAVQALDANAGPSRVLIKVNLDDNNE